MADYPALVNSVQCLRFAPLTSPAKVNNMKSFFSFCAITAVLAGAASPVFAVPASAPTAAECAAPTTQKRMNECAYEDFLVATASYAEGHKAVASKLLGKQRALFLRSQKAWMAYRTAACDFESSGAQGGSAQGMVKWQCAARITRARVVELKAMGNCPEGDLACVGLKK